MFLHENKFVRKRTNIYILFYFYDFIKLIKKIRNKQGEYFYYQSYLHFWKSFWKSITRVFFPYLKLLI